MNKTVDSSIVKLTNYRSVWGYIHKNKQATIPQISKDIGLSLPTVTRAVDYGVAEGIIEPDGVIGADKLISLIKEKLKAYLLPEFKLGRDFFEDCFRGLSIMCELEIKRSLRERLDF